MIHFISNQTSLFAEENSLIIFSSIETCLQYFKDKNIIEVDTETEGCKWNKDRLPDPYTSKVLCLQLGDTETQFVIDLATVNISVLKPLFQDKDKVKIFCNAFFDLRFFHHWGFEINNVYDVFLTESILHKGKILPPGFRSLKEMSLRYLGVERDKEIRGQIHWRGLDSTVIKYAADDVAFMSEIRKLQLVEIEKWNLQQYLKLESRYVIDLSLMAYNGFKLNPDKWLKVKEDNLKRLSKLHENLNQYILDKNLTKYIDYTLFGNYCKINWKSSKQVIPLFKDLGIDTQVRDKVTGKMKDSVDIKPLKKKLKLYDILPLYIEYKELDKEITTYGEDFIKDNLNPISKRVHSEFFQILDTSRISSNTPNLQNIPASTNEGETHPLRECFEPEEGNTLVVCDFSQQEPRITADFSQDPVLIDFMLNGDGDMHSFVSTLISPKLLGEEIKVTKKNNPLVPQYGQKLRDVGKMINLGLDYGKTAFTLKDDLGCSQEAAQELIDFLFSRTPQKQAYFKSWQLFVEANGYIISDNSLGCITHFALHNEYIRLRNIPERRRTKEERSSFYKIKGQMERFAQNNRIQNTGALMTKTSHILINNEFKKFNLEAKVVNAIHDELVVECKENIAKQVADIVVKKMIEAGLFFCKTIPMKVDPVITKVWTK